MHSGFKFQFLRKDLRLSADYIWTRSRAHETSFIAFRSQVNRLIPFSVRQALKTPKLQRQFNLWAFNDYKWSNVFK